MKTLKCYKLLRRLKSRPGQLFPLFIGKSQPVLFGRWMPAECLKTTGYAVRPGWHVSIKPWAPHLLKRDGTLAEDRVWVEARIPGSDWQGLADMTPSGDLMGNMPTGGFYRFPRPKNQGGEWLIAGSIKFMRVLTAKQVREINAR